MQTVFGQVRWVHALAGWMAVTTLTSVLAAEPDRVVSPATPSRNVFGVNLGFDPGWNTTATVRLLGLARHLVGDWGYIRPSIHPSDDVEATRRGMAMIRAHHLIPISGGGYPDKEFCEKGKAWPRLDPDGTMRTAARAKARIWRRMYEEKVPFYVIEVLNEINGKWPADKYAQWLYDLTVEVKAAYPGLKVCSCGMAGSGADYYDELLTIKPELKKVVDFWGLHPYGANHPPESRVVEVSLRSYELTAAVLRKHGVDPIRLMCTETGYELEFAKTGADPAFPPIGEQNRATYMAEAFRRYYVPDARIVCVAPFMLWDLPFHNWDGWDFVGPDGRPKPMYDAVAALPLKTGGADWMPTGNGRISGRITWAASKIGVPRAIVYVEPGLYGAVTDDDGRYEIANLPPGRYRIAAFRNGNVDVPARPIVVDAVKPARFDARMDSASLVRANLGTPATNDDKTSLPGWTVIGAGRPGVTLALDNKVLFRNRRTQRIDLSSKTSASLFSFGGYGSGYPGELFVSEVFVRGPRAIIGSPTSEDVGHPSSGPWLAAEMSSGRGEILAAAKVFATDFRDDGEWHRITAAICAPPKTSRVRVSFGVQDAAGTFWFGDLYIGEAEFPLPTDVAMRTTGYVPPNFEANRSHFAQAVADVKQRNPELKAAELAGVVTDFQGRPLAATAVATDSPLFAGVTDANGKFRLTVPADRPLHVRAFAADQTMIVSPEIRLSVGEQRTVDLKVPPPPANPHLVNGAFNQFNSRECGLVPGWTTFGTTDGATAGGKTIYGVPAFEGEGFYFAQSGSNTKNGGAWQMIESVPHRKYRLTGRVYTQTEGGHKQPMDNNCRLGLDPTGGRDPKSKDISWTLPTDSEQKWTPVQVEVTAKSERLTVFLIHEMRRANTWNLTLFDDLKLEQLP